MARRITQHEIEMLKHVVWGNVVQEEIFNRWSQGFIFSKSEPTALEQKHGGPCSVIAPVQAFILTRLLNEYQNLLFRQETILPSKQNTLLGDALIEILTNSSSGKIRLALKMGNEENEMAIQTQFEYECSLFHDNIHIREFTNVSECKTFLLENIEVYKRDYGVLLFLVSVIFTKGVTQIMNESDTQDSLIDSTHGHGSQSLINLMLTGKAVSNVWDHEQDVGGLKLRGLDAPSQVGFITLMEHLRYCTVGSFYKNPIHPVWLLGSETHLTVLFSSDRRLVRSETKSEEARRIFKNYDKEGNNFIQEDNLKNVLADLNLVCEDEYVKLIRKKLALEDSGIILLPDFMDEFFPKQESSQPDIFQVIHYNGLAQSNQGQVKYRMGSAVLLESNVDGLCESNPMLTVLQTKWPMIDVYWAGNETPSLN